MIFNGIEKLSLVDFGSYTSCTLFTAGCNFLCPFCHNAVLVTGKQPEIEMDEIMSYLNKRKGILDGVAITGGEPTLHKDLPDFIKIVKDMGFLVKLDSNGTNPQMLEKLIDERLIDYVAMDIKSDKEGYPLVAGLKSIDLAPIQQSIDLLKSGRIGYEFRTTLVKEFHTEKVIENIASWLDGAQNYFLQKFEDKGGNLESGLNPVDKETAIIFKDILSKRIKNVSLRNYD